MSKVLHKYKILIADEDPKLGGVLKLMLEEMGFRNVYLTQSGNKALELLQDYTFDFLITEWNVRHINGLKLINRIRRGPTTIDPTLPIIMLTGRAEKKDVLLARDQGINEYVIKPFNAKTIFSRLERLVENPRQFVVASNFVGPDRRYNSAPPEGIAERRKRSLEAVPRPANPSDEIHTNTTPTLWTPDYSLKLKLGLDTRLSSLITPAILNLAQAAIDSIAQESLQWIRDDLTQLRALLDRLKQGDTTATLSSDMGEIALTMSARAGTFGYGAAGEVAYLLYLFCTGHLDPQQPLHRLIAEKHIDVLQVSLGNSVRAVTTLETEEVVKELKNLVEKYAA